MTYARNRWNYKLTLLCALGLLGLLGCPADDDDDDTAMPDDDVADDDTAMPDDDAADDDSAGGFTLTSRQFDEGGEIPVEHSCDNPSYDQGVSPHLEWTDPPAGTMFFALTVVDPDANDCAHWGVFDIPAETTTLDNQLRPDNPLPGHAWEVIVYTGVDEYAGPCPPPAHDPHHYVFTIYALDEGMPDFDTTPTLAEMDSHIAERLLDSAQLTGTYDR